MALLAELRDAGGGEERLGAALLALADAARLIGLESEIALNGAINRYIARYEAAEQALRAAGNALEALPEADLQSLYWDCVKL